MVVLAKSHKALVAKLKLTGTERVDAREWNTDWAERWVVFADLIAFASRAERSPDVVLNNIVRFARASHIAEQAVPVVRTFRFSDSTFAIADHFEQALAFSIAIHHACHGINVASVLNKDAPVFHYTIMPRITMARGQVLICQDGLKNIPTHYSGLNPKNILAGAGIVAAYKLERESAGGLLTMDSSCLSELAALAVRGGNRSTSASFERWRSYATTKAPDAFFIRGKVLDFPWLLLRPFQNTIGELWCSDKADFKFSVQNFLDLWELSIREFYFDSKSLSLSATKHADAAIRHAVQCIQAVSGHKCGIYYNLSEVRQTLMNSFKTT
jgi:hypothetical protein